MNLTLDRQPLSTAQLLAIAEAAGLDVARIRSQMVTLHSEAASRSLLLQATAEARHAMWARGELALGAVPFQAKPAKEVDPDVFAWYLSITRKEALCPAP